MTQRRNDIAELLELEKYSRYALAGPLVEGRRVLDLEPPGAAAVALLQDCGAAEVTCVTNATEALQSELQHWGAHAELMAAVDAPPLPCADAAYEFVLVHDLAARVAQSQAWWAELRRVLHPEGYILAAVPHAGGHSLQELSGISPETTATLNYETAWQFLAEYFEDGTAFAQSPLVGHLFYDLGSEEEDPDPTYDRSLVQNDEEEPGWYVLLFGPRAYHRDDYALVQLEQEVAVQAFRAHHHARAMAPEARQLGPSDDDERAKLRADALAAETELQKVRGELASALRAVEAERDALQEKLDVAQQQLQQTVPAKDDAHERNLRERITDLANRLTDRNRRLEQAQDAAQQAQARASEAEAQAQALQDQLATVQQQGLEHAQTLQQTQQQLEHAQQQLEAAQQALAARTRELHEARRGLRPGALPAHIERLLARLEEDGHARQVLLEQRERSWSGRLAQQQQQLQLAQALIRRTSSEVDAQRHRAEAAEKQLAAAQATASHQTHELRALRAHQHQQSQALHAAEQRTHAAQQALATQRAQLHAAHAALAQMDAQARSQRQKLESEAKNVARALQAAQQERATLEARLVEVEQAREELAQANAALATQLDDERAASQRAREEAQRLREQARAAERELAALEEEHQAATGERDALRQERDTANQAKQTLQDERAELQSQLEQYKSQLEQYKTQLQERDDTLQAGRQRTNELEASLENALQDNQNLQQQVHDYEALHASLRETLAHERQHREEQQQELTRLQTASDQHQSELEAVNSQLHALQETLQHAEQQRDDAQNQLREAEMQRESLQSQLLEAQSAREAAERRALDAEQLAHQHQQELKSAQEQAQAQVRAAEQEAQELIEQADRSARNRVEQAERERAPLERELAAMRDTTTQLQDEVAALQEDNEQLRARLHTDSASGRTDTSHEPARGPLGPVEPNTPTSSSPPEASAAHAPLSVSAEPSPSAPELHSGRLGTAASTNQPQTHQTGTDTEQVTTEEPLLGELHLSLDEPTDADTPTTGTTGRWQASEALTSQAMRPPNMDPVVATDRAPPVRRSDADPAAPAATTPAAAAQGAPTGPGGEGEGAAALDELEDLLEPTFAGSELKRPAEGGGES